jgi:hypothetical protein
VGKGTEDLLKRIIVAVVAGLIVKAMTDRYRRI